jgi:hypothetical protein
MFTVTFSNQSVKRCKGELQRAYVRGDLRSVRRLSVLIMISERKSIESIRASWDISEPTIYDWLKEFVGKGWKSLMYGKMSGRPARLSKTQSASCRVGSKLGRKRAAIRPVVGRVCWSRI